MAEVSDYYQALEVDETAEPDAIKKAYRRLARAYHPDRNPGDPNAEERFKTIQEAYETLSDPVRRKAYDRERRFGSPSGAGGFGSPFDTSAFGGFDTGGAFRGARAGSSFSGADGFDPLFSFFFSGENAQRPAPLHDVETELKLTFDQALRGGRTEVRLPDGETVRLAIPRGVRSGLKVRVRGHGETDDSGARSDLYVTFRVEPSPRFRREGDHLHIVEAVSAIEAIVGTTRPITNAYGQTVKVQIPPGTQPGERLRLRGQGVATDAKTGDLFVEVQVVVPRELTQAQRDALAAAARETGLL